MARPPLVELDRASLRRFERNLDALGTVVVPSAAKDAARSAGKQAQVLLSVAFRRHIGGGPAPATRIHPGSASSSVLVVESKTTADEIGIDLQVSPRAARWLQFQLGDRKRRRPGEVGVAHSANWVPQTKRLRRLGFRMPYGNLAMGTLAELVAMSQSQTSDTTGGVFYREARKKSAAGFYRRTGRDTAPQLLVAAARQSRYRGNMKLQAAWTNAVERAGGRMTADAAREIMKRVDRMAKGGNGGGKVDGPTAFEK
ncbi:hypothetical protein [Aureimonas glaciei]|uniref:Uncharacterized protein n=1 Tax=Aureimonas glaciei TaxID=1776957 RepID=A0A916YGL9_9HYPH|nr:hypothetical protein [Aureimonas glaciei]GGD43818.1 hypothetical protein GCM10011335_53060 [Aureimonas glaciei]